MREDGQTFAVSQYLALTHPDIRSNDMRDGRTFAVYKDYPVFLTPRGIFFAYDDKGETPTEDNSRLESETLSGLRDRIDKLDKAKKRAAESKTPDELSIPIWVYGRYPDGSPRWQFVILRRVAVISSRYDESATLLVRHMGKPLKVKSVRKDSFMVALVKSSLGTKLKELVDKQTALEKELKEIQGQLTKYNTWSTIRVPICLSSEDVPEAQEELIEEIARIEKEEE